MAHGRGENCGCFPTGLNYPGIAEQLRRSRVPLMGLAAEFDPYSSFLSLPLAVIDTETTGKDPARGDRVVEIAIVYFDGNEVTERYAQIVDPGMPIPAEASAVHGIKDEHVKGQPKWDQVAQTLCAKLKGRIPVAYNAGFDRGFIFAEMRRAGVIPSTDKNLPPAMRTNCEWIDPLTWARSVQSEMRGFKLGEVAERLGIKLVTAHRATDDAEAAGQVLRALVTDTALTYRDAIQRQKEAMTLWERTRGAWQRR